MIGSLSKTNSKLVAAQRRACWFWCCMLSFNMEGLLYITNSTLDNKP